MKCEYFLTIYICSDSEVERSGKEIAQYCHVVCVTIDGVWIGEYIYCVTINTSAYCRIISTWGLTLL
jgi:hypothetical protein